MKIAIELYGGLRQRAGRDELSVELNGAPEAITVADVVAAVEDQFPVLAGALDRVARAVDDEIVGDDHGVEDGATIALLPPVSGGSDRRHLSMEPLSIDELLAETEDPRCGGLVVFSGDVRDHNQGRDDVVAIEYEAHAAIAGRILQAIENEALEQFDIRHCRVQHRLGRVEVGESSVLVVCRAPHRDAAFRAARYAIDELKERTPLWKRECYADGESRYLDGTSIRDGHDDEEKE